jgi:benzodiazapine receptor
MIFRYFSSKKYEVVGTLLCLTLGSLVGFFSGSGSSEWYLHLSKPWFNPPNFIFGPVWSFLYILMGIALGKIWLSKNKKLLAIFVFQFLVNLAWPFSFFYGQRIDLALLIVGILWLTLLYFMYSAWRGELDFLVLMFLPYFFWVSFAFALNLKLILLN